MPLELQPGDVYAGNIRILDILGTGAFACVYKVDVPGYDKPMALKLTKEPVTAGDQAQRALREITILRSLTNPHVVRSFDCGLRPDGHIYMLMDFLAGKALDEWHDFTTALEPSRAATNFETSEFGSFKSPKLRAPVGHVETQAGARDACGKFSL